MVSLNQNGEPKKSRYGGGSITKLPSGSWILKWYGPADQEGKRKRLTHTFKGSKADANKKLRELQNGSYPGDWDKINPKRLTLHGRGPRRIAELRDGVRKGSYTSDLPIRHSKTVDLYIHNNYRSRSWYNDTRSI